MVSSFQPKEYKLIGGQTRICDFLENGNSITGTRIWDNNFIAWNEIWANSTEAGGIRFPQNLNLENTIVPHRLLNHPFMDHLEVSALKCFFPKM